MGNAGPCVFVSHVMLRWVLFSKIAALTPNTSGSMADALASWLLDYVLSVSETYGANLSNVKFHAKGRKVQITEVEFILATVLPGLHLSDV